MSNLTQFTVSSQPHAAGDVREILEAHAALERTKATRQLWVHVLAVVGGLIGLCLLFPEVTSARLQAVLLALWGTCCAASLAAAAMEWKWQRRAAQLLAANRATPQS